MTHEEPQAGSNADTEEFLEPGQRSHILIAMAETFQTLGYNVHARLSGLYEAPALVEGTIESHRPDLTARMPSGVGIILEVVTAERINAASKHRWDLLAHAARVYGAEVHFAVSAWEDGRDLPGELRRLLERWEITPRKVWTL